VDKASSQPASRTTQAVNPAQNVNLDFMIVVRQPFANHPTCNLELLYAPNLWNGNGTRRLHALVPR
jgi:hypothetical protein